MEIGTARREGATMDWRVFITTFGVIFLAEMGDKTQLAAMTMAAETKKPLAVFIGAALALVCVSAVGVAVGGLLSQYIPIIWVKRVSAVAFIVVGVLILMDKL
jgi:Ca2+/H+ antiporter, TMEM165/GDT1 family